MFLRRGALSRKSRNRVTAIGLSGTQTSSKIVRFPRVFHGRSVTTPFKRRVCNDGRSPPKSVLSRTGVGLQLRSMMSCSRDGAGRVNSLVRFRKTSEVPVMVRNLNRVMRGAARRNASSICDLP